MKKVSVIIPAFNAEKLIRKATESALQFEEVGEVILVEDGSPDNTFEVCKQLEKENEKVKLYYHPDHTNKGAGASRNLGIKKSNYDYLAFIDADDYFLPNRFDAERKLLFEDEKVDGVYGAIGTVYYSDEANKLFKETSQPELLTVRQVISPEDLKYAMLGMSRDYHGSAFFSLDALTVKKSLIEKVGYLNEKLRLHQDTDIIIKMAFLGKLVPGIIDKPVGMRGIHGRNRITSEAYGVESRYLQFVELEKWLIENNTGDEKVRRFVRKILSGYEILKDEKFFSRVSHLIRLFKQEPYLFYIDREFNYLVKGVFGDNLPTKAFVKLKKLIFHILFSKTVNEWQLYLYH